jgi:SAM-dependent methyltransferase
MTYHERDTCRLCDAKLPEERVLDLGEAPLANALCTQRQAWQYRGEASPPRQEFTAPLYLKQCVSCGHVQLPIVVDPKLLFPEDYPYASATGESMRAHLRRMAEDLTFGMDENALAVEIGSNDGYLLSHLRDRGTRAVGIDPAAKLASSATASGDLTIPEFFNVATARAVRNACGQADLIVANNVFAHADDLHEIVEGVKALLAKDGRFVFEVGYLPDVIRTNNFGTVYHEHLSYHSIVPLSNLFARHGLRLFKAERVSTQGGSVRCFVSRNALFEDLSTLVALDAVAQADLGAWQSRVTKAADAFGQRIHFLRNKGATIAGFGCSAKSTTLLHVADIGREQISFICDDAPSKQGKYSPGKHIPIVPGSWLEEKQPDYCVSLSGNFSEAFKAEHPGFKGEWIEPVLT